MKRILCLLLCLCLALSLPLTALAGQEREAIHLYTVEDLQELAKNCILDSYSRDKIVYLHADLDLTGVEFSGIPTFGGTFEGRGHTISGLELIGAGSAAGLFRYVLAGGVVRQLTVSGRVAPGGSAASVGGIVGVNRGLLTDCRFEGSVAGSSNVGAIAGVNEAEGCILRCASQGVVVGQNMTGGIVGYNKGLVEGCENQAGVNIHTPDASLDISSIDLSVLMDPSALSTGITVMDTGGIVGYSVGSIYDCTNLATVGYPHIGYNVGGIAGRSSGTVSGCVNQAVVQGRKDVGGIVGQMEPNVSLNLDEDHLLQLETQFRELEQLLRQLQTSTDRLGGANAHLNNTLDHIDGASVSLEVLTGYIGDYGSALTDEFNRTSLLLQDALNQMLPVLEQAVVLGESLETATRTMAEAMDAFGETAQQLGGSISLMRTALNDLQTAGAHTTQAIEQVMEGLALLASSLQIEDPEQTALALEQIKAGLQQLSDAATQAGEAARKIAEVLQQEGNWDADTAAAFAQALEAMADMGDALQTISTGLTLLMENMELDPDALQAGFDSLSAGGAALLQALNSLQEGAEGLSLALGALDRAVGLGGYALNTLATGAQQLADSLQQLTHFGELLHTAVTNISHYEPIQLPQLDSGAQEEADKIFDSVNAISDELRSILAISDAFSQEAKQQLNDIFDKFTQILETTMKLADQVLDTASGGLIQDTSDADVDAIKAGKVSDCVNEGMVCADLNAGGIAGAMGIDYQLDPEDDLTGQLSQTRLRTYQAKAIVQSCTNRGVIDGKRSYIGGICGRMDMGIILNAYNFGNVSSAGGDYVGGIAGASAGVIRSCAIKADLTGGKYVGGVAGYAVAVADCSAMVQLVGQEFVGAILGAAEDGALERITANFYFTLDKDPGAIDGISYDGHAQAASWDAFLDGTAADQQFAQAALTFRFADGTTQVLHLPVGTVLEADMIPVLDKNDQQILFWEGLDSQLGQAQYFDRIFTERSKNRITVLESGQTRPNGKPILLLQGSFLVQEQLQLQPLTDGPEALEGWQFEIPAGGSVTQIRYALPEGAEEVEILARNRDGDLVKVPHSRSGSYLVFSLEEGVTAFYVSVPLNHNPWRQYTGIAVGVLVIITGSAILLAKKRKKSK